MRAQLETHTVLVVDDSPETVSMLNDVLVNANFATLVALNGEQAIAMTQNFTPDIILLDAIMPGIDGFESARQLLQNKSMSNVPIIIMTGLTDTADVVKGFEAGCTDYVTKPIVNEELIARMRVHLAKAKLTVSAKNALDTTGKHLFSTDKKGVVQWATPQCQTVFDGFDKTSAESVQQLREKIWTVIEGGTQSPITVRIQSGEHTHEITYVSSSSYSDHILQVNKLVTDSNIETIRSVFSITKRESEVLFWLSKAKTNKEIGLVLSMSHRTVNKHLEQIYKKLGVDNRTAAAGLCLSKINQQ